LGIKADSEAVLGSILDETSLGSLWPPLCKDFVATCPSIELSARGRQVPVVVDMREKEEITLGVRKSQGHTSRVFKLETGEECGLVFW
jgi:hypothetical protein